MLQPGEQIGVWTVEARLGPAASSQVFQARHREDATLKVALKVLDPTRPDWRPLRQRLLRDAEAWLSLSHPSLAKVRAIQLAGQPPTIELELVEGQRLSVPRAPPSPGRVVDQLRDAAEGLAALHAAGLRHRDVKLDNLIVRASDGRVVLVDLGTWIQPRDVALAMLPPEIDGPSSVDGAMADVYALGVVAWQLLAARPAFQDAARQGLAEVSRLKRALGPLDPGDDLPLDLRALVREMTHPLPRKRLASMRQVVERLEALNLERTDPNFRFDKTTSTWDPEDPSRSARMSQTGNATWMSSDPGMSEHAAPTLPPPEPDERLPEAPADDAPTEEAARADAPEEPPRPRVEPPPTKPPRTTGSGLVAADRTSRALLALIALLVVALFLSLLALLGQG